MRCWGIYLSTFVWANNSLLAIIGKGVENQRLFSFYIIIKLNKTEAIMGESKTVTHWCYGHFHQSWHSNIDGILLKMLDIMEFYEIK